jgi:MFS family permease
MSSLAILLLVRGATGSYAAAGAAVGAYALASAAMAPVQGRLVDRFGRLRVLAPSAAGQGVALLALVLVAHGHAGSVALVLLSGLAGVLVPPIAPTVRALLRDVFRDPAVRETAYALESVTQELVWIVGPLLVALIVTVASPSGALLALAAVCIGGTVLFVRSPLARDEGVRVASHDRTGALANPRLRALLGPIALTGIGLGATEVGLPSLALHAGSRSASGLLLALWSVGSMTGGLWYGSRPWRSSLAGRYRVLLVLAVLATAPLIGARSIATGVVCSLIAGLVIAPVFSCQYALVGRTVTAGSENEAFTWVTAALVSGLAAGSAAGGAVISSAGVSAPFVLSCLATALAAVLAITLRHHVEQPANVPTAPDPEHSSARSPARDGWTVPGGGASVGRVLRSEEE